MAERDLSKIESNYKAIINEIAISEGGDSKKNISNYAICSEKFYSELSIEDLDYYFDKGLTGNETTLSDNLWSLIIGYALISRYSLPIDEYIKWANSQNNNIYILKLVGINVLPKSLKKEKHNLHQDFNLDELQAFLDSKKHLMNYSKISTNTSLTLFGKAIEINDVVKKISDLRSALSDAQEYSTSVLDNGLSLRCVDYKTCSENIVSVLKDAIDAEWIKCKKYLKHINTSDNLIEDIHSQFIDSSSDIYEIKKILDNAVSRLHTITQGKADEIANKNYARKDREFFGGGFGVKGAVTGMIGASLLSALNSSVADACEAASVNNLKSETDKKLNEIFIGDNTIDIYYQLIETACEELDYICLKSLFPDDLEDQAESEAIIKLVQDQLSIFSGDQLRKFASDIMFIYPFSTNSYDFIFDNFYGIRDELVEISDALCMQENEIKEGRLINISDSGIVFDDMAIEFSGPKEIVFKYLKYCGKCYELTIPMESKFFKEDNLTASSNEGVSHDFCMQNGETGDIIRGWGGEEGRETYIKETNQSKAQILDQINSFSNVRIKDFGQEIIIKKNSDNYIEILRAVLLWDNKEHDVYMLTYLDEDTYFSICYGNSNGMKNNYSNYKKALEDIKISKLNMQTCGKFDYLTNDEIIDILQTHTRNEADEYYKLHKDEIDDEFILCFRKRFKTLVKRCEYGNNLLNEYDYNTHNSDIINIFKNQIHKGQYILYYSDKIIVTDFYFILLGAEGIALQIDINKICEILFVTPCFSENDTKICCRLIDGKCKIISADIKAIDELICISDCVNEALDPLIDTNMGRYYRDARLPKNEDLVLCQKCNRVTHVFYDSDGIHCSYCHSDSDNLYKLIKDKSINAIPADIEKEIEEYANKGLFTDELEYANQHNVSEKAFDYSQSDLKKIYSSKNYIYSNIENLDYQSAIIFRILFKAILLKYADPEGIVNKYDYELKNGILKEFMDSQKQKGQYILYDNFRLIITDFNVYFIFKDSVCCYKLNEIIEILPMQEIYGSGFAGICIRNKYNNKVGTNSMIVDDKISDSILILNLINIVLEKADTILHRTIIDRYYVHQPVDGNNEFFLCGECNKFGFRIVEAGRIFNHIHCSNCYASILTKSYRIINSEDIEEKRNGLNAEILGNEESLIEREKKYDKEHNGLLEFALDTYSKISQRKAQNIDNNHCDSTAPGTKRATNMNNINLDSKAEPDDNNDCKEPIIELKNNRKTENKINSVNDVEKNNQRLPKETVTETTNNKTGEETNTFTTSNLVDNKEDNTSEKQYINENKTQNDDKVICPYCKSANPKGAIFCTNCGKKIKMNSTIFCPTCGRKIDRNSLYCIYCGSKNTYLK